MAGLYLASGVSQATVLLGSNPCAIFSKASPGVPDEIGALFHAAERKIPPEAQTYFANMAVERCDYGAAAAMGRLAYAALMPPSAGGGVCYYSRLNITPVFSKDGKLLDIDVPDRNGSWPVQRMMLAEPPCPRQDDKSYVQVEKISPGVFRSLMTFWQGVSGSEARLDDALSQLTSETRNKPEYRSFRAVVLNPRGRSLRPWSIRLGYIRPSYRDDGGNAALYEIDVAGFVVLVDLTDQGWRIQRIEQPIP